MWKEGQDEVTSPPVVQRYVLIPVKELPKYCVNISVQISLFFVLLNLNQSDYCDSDESNNY